jgi:hypothetical protein
MDLGVELVVRQWATARQVVHEAGYPVRGDGQRGLAFADRHRHTQLTKVQPVHLEQVAPDVLVASKTVEDATVVSDGASGCCMNRLVDERGMKDAFEGGRRLW